MFGLEDQKKSADQPIEFDLEKELRDPERCFKIKKQVEKRVQSLKSLLQSGIEKSEFEQIGALLYGYAALLKVVERILSKKKK